MSIWTYIQGSVEIGTSPFRFKLNKDGTYKEDKSEHVVNWYETRYLPFPEEQLKFGKPNPRVKKNNKDATAYLEFDANINSFPILKRVVAEKAGLLPSGESDVITYFLNNDHERYNSSTSCCESKHVNDLFITFLKDFYKDQTWTGITAKELLKYFPSELSWTHENEESILTIHDSVRYCSADEMYVALINFFKALTKEDVIFDDGILTFNDYFNFYTMRFLHDSITVEIKKDGEETKTEYWQIFTKWYNDRPFTNELKSVDHIYDWRELQDESGFKPESEE